MVKKIYMILFAVTVMAAGTSCEKDDDIRTVDPIFTNALTTQYPDAGWVEWEREHGFIVAEFWHNGSQTKVWYDSKAQWAMTETNLGRNLDKLPPAVLDTFGKTAYTSWTVEDLDEYARPDGTYYLIEVEKHGEKDRDLYFSQTGILLKDSVEKGDFLPTSKF